MAATSKAELIAVSDKEFDKLIKLVKSFQPDQAMEKQDEDTSVKDIIAHRAHWIDLFLGWYWDGQAGKAVYFPAEGYKWNDLKRYNADLRASQSDIDWSTAQILLQDGYEKLMRFIENRSEAELYGAPMKGAKNAWTPGRWAEAAGPSHFRSAAKYLRSVRKQLQS